MFKAILAASALSAALLVSSATASPVSVSDAPASPDSLAQEDGDDAKKKKKKEAKKKDPKIDRKALGHYDVSKKGLALGGYDPVAYFSAYGGKPKKGSKKITTKHRGVVYRFASDANKKAFLAAPDRFEPAYGGWCAWAMSDGKGSKTEANPKSFTIEGGRLFVFYDGLFGDTRKQWKKNGSAPKLAASANKNWERISGEAPPKTAGK